MNMAEIENSTIEPEAVSSLSLMFCLRLARAYAVLTRRLDNGLASVHGLSFGDFMALYHLQRAPGAKLRRVDLAERLGLTASGVTRTLLPLEKLGLVARQPDPRDARVGYASITLAGGALLANAMVSVELLAREATQRMSEDEIEHFSAMLGQIAGINLSNE
jgi:DNA-binding MarR family transcriptional regulator